MNKSGIMMISALMTLGLASAAMAADMPKAVTVMAVDAPATANTLADTSTAAKKHKKHKKPPALTI